MIKQIFVSSTRIYKAYPVVSCYLIEHRFVFNYRNELEIHVFLKEHSN